MTADDLRAGARRDADRNVDAAQERVDRLTTTLGVAEERLAQSRAERMTLDQSDQAASSSTGATPPLNDEPTDPQEERHRLLRDAASAGVDPTDATRVADRAAPMLGHPAADRAVDRLLATGYTIEQAQRIVEGDPDPGPASGDSDE